MLEWKFIENIKINNFCIIPRLDYGQYRRIFHSSHLYEFGLNLSQLS